MPQQRWRSQLNSSRSLFKNRKFKVSQSLTLCMYFLIVLLVFFFYKQQLSQLANIFKFTPSNQSYSLDLSYDIHKTSNHSTFSNASLNARTISHMVPGQFTKPSPNPGFLFDTSPSRQAHGFYRFSEISTPRKKHLINLSSPDSSGELPRGDINDVYPVYSLHLHRVIYANFKEETGNFLRDWLHNPKSLDPILQRKIKNTCFKSKEKEGRAEKNIAIIVASTTSQVSLNQQIIDRLALTRLCVPSFLRTMEQCQYNYTWYLGLDHDDVFWSNSTHVKTLRDLLAVFEVGLNVFYFDDHAPAPIMSKLAVKAYEDGHDYFLRTNDDVAMLSGNWTTAFIQALTSFKPQNMGVACPNVKQGHTDWITRIYTPNNSKILEDIHFYHAINYYGTRYTPHKEQRQGLQYNIRESRKLISKWCKEKNFKCQIGSKRRQNESLSEI